MHHIARIGLPAAAAALAVAPTFAGASAPPRYAMGLVSSFDGPASSRIAAQSRIFGFDAQGRGYGYSVTPGDGGFGGTLGAVRWESGRVTPLAGASGDLESYAAGVNGVGAAIGWRQTDAGGSGAVWRAGGMVDLGEMLPTGINSSGVVAGVVRNPESPRWYAPAVWRDGSVTRLEMAQGFAHSWVVGVSDAGDVAGSVYGPGLTGQRAVVWSADGSARVLPMPAGASATEARGVGADGTVVGMGVTADGGVTPMMWRNGEAITLAGMHDGVRAAWAEGVNTRGQVVGVAETATGRTAFLWHEGRMWDLRDLVEGFSAAGDEEFNAMYLVIGETGHIAGVRFSADGRGEGFVLVPLPGAGTGVGMLVGLGMLAARRRR